MSGNFLRCGAYLLVSAALLTACGGGGGSGDSGGSTTSPVAPAFAALTFTPAVASATLEAGKSHTVSVGASVNRPGDFDGAVYTLIVDNTGVLLPNARFSSLSPTQYTASLQTSASLAPGNYKGTFSVNLCRDQSCSRHYAGSPMQLPYDFTVKDGATSLVAQASAPLDLTLNVGSNAPAPVSVKVLGIPLSWTATSSAPWLVLKNASGTGIGSFTVEFDTSKAIEGVQSGTIVVKSSDGQQVQLAASLSMISKSFTVSQNGFTFTAVNGAPITPQKITFDLEGGGSWSSSSNVSWLNVTPENGSLPGQATVSINPAKGALASGPHNGNFVLSSPSGKQRSVSVSLNLTRPVLSLSKNIISLGGTFGRDFTNDTVTMHLNTLDSSWPWKLNALPTWVNASAQNGEVNQNGTSVRLTANLQKAPVGSSTTVVHATAQVNGDTLSNPITLTINRDQQKILPSETGLAMVSVPGWSRLVRTVTVRDNFGADTDWSASSNQNWLRVARNGNQLTLTGDPSGLPDDVTSYATVTLSSNAPGVSTPEVVRVALWKGSKAPEARSEIQTHSSTQLLADTIRPLVYVHETGSTLDAYNVYTGQKVASSTALGNRLGAMAMSANGDYLYVYDIAGRSILVLNAQTLAKLTTWTLPNEISPFSNLLSIRPNGEELVITNVGEAFRVANGQRFQVNMKGALAATRDGNRVYSNVEGATGYAFDMDFTAIGGGSLHLGAARWFGVGTSGRDIAVSPDGKRYFMAAGADQRCSVGDASTLKVIGDLPGGEGNARNVEVDSFGRVYCGGLNWYGKADVWLHDSNGVELKQFRVTDYSSELQPRQMVISPDGMMLIGLSHNFKLIMMRVGP